MITHHKELGLPLKANDKDQVPTVVFFSGFPDSWNSFEAVYPAFLETHHVIIVIMPHYDQSSMWWPFLGPSFESITASLLSILSPAHSSGSPITLVGHDWGAYCVARFVHTHPTVVQKMILLDVSTYPDKKHLPLTLCYQLVSVLSFVLSRIPLFGWILGLLPIALYPWKTIGPCPNEFNMPSKPLETKPFMCYPYFHLYIGTLLFRDFTNVSPKLVDSVPTLFLYGCCKRVFFHSPEFLRLLDARDDCDYVELNCGHWVSGHYERFREARTQRKVAILNTALIASQPRVQYKRVPWAVVLGPWVRLAACPGLTVCQSTRLSMPPPGATVVFAALHF